jgi:hypothetical protein
MQIDLGSLSAFPKVFFKQANLIGPKRRHPWDHECPNSADKQMTDL